MRLCVGWVSMGIYHVEGYLGRYLVRHILVSHKGSRISQVQQFSKVKGSHLMVGLVLVLHWAVCDEGEEAEA